MALLRSFHSWRRVTRHAKRFRAFQHCRRVSRDCKRNCLSRWHPRGRYRFLSNHAVDNYANRATDCGGRPSSVRFAPGVIVLALGMFCSGFGGAWVWIPTPVVASAAFAPEKRGTAIGLLSSGMALSIVFTSQLAGWVRRIWGDEGWRNVYVVQAVLGLLIAAGTIAVVRHAQEQLSDKGSIGGFDALRRVPGWKPVTAMYTTFGFMYLLVLAFMSSRLEDDNGWSASTASLSFTLIGLGMVVGGPIIAKSVALFGTRATLATAFSLWSTL